MTTTKEQKTMNTYIIDYTIGADLDNNQTIEWQCLANSEAEALDEFEFEYPTNTYTVQSITLVTA